MPCWICSRRVSITTNHILVVEKRTESIVQGPLFLACGEVVRARWQSGDRDLPTERLAPPVVLDALGVVVP